jgi:hypothetical protein
MNEKEKGDREVPASTPFPGGGFEAWGPADRPPERPLRQKTASIDVRNLRPPQRMSRPILPRDEGVANKKVEKPGEGCENQSS